MVSGTYLYNTWSGLLSLGAEGFCGVRYRGESGGRAAVYLWLRVREKGAVGVN